MTDTEMAVYLAQAKVASLAQARALAADCREDEARLEKIRANVYDIFSAVHKLALQKPREEREAFFLEKLETIPANWRRAYEAAESHSEAEKRMVEETKLAAADEIRRRYGRREGEAHDGE